LARGISIVRPPHRLNVNPHNGQIDFGDAFQIDDLIAPADLL